MDRSATGQAGPGNQALASLVVDPAGSGGGAATLDQQGNPATAVGEDALTVPVSGGLQPEPALPYVRATVEYAGTAGPGATVHLFAAPGAKAPLSQLGETTAGADGTWSLTTRPLPAGQYRVVVEANAPLGPRGRPATATMKPIDWPGRLVAPPKPSKLPLSIQTALSPENFQNTQRPHSSI